MRIAITGANGFVGRNLGPALLAAGGDVVALSREPVAWGSWRRSPSLDRDTDPGEWAASFRGVDVVVHAAARAHVMHDDAIDPLDAFRRVNRDGTIAMARGAIAAGVRRIVFLSSIKVLGETTDGRAPFDNDDPPAPADPYAVSKWEAEVALAAAVRGTATDLVVLRPPLIYGPGVGGNIAALRRLLARRWWLPLARADANRRSMISTGNLSTAIHAAATVPAAAGRTLLVSDGEDMSTGELLRRLATADGGRPRLFAVPPEWLRLAMLLTGRRTLWSRLFGDLRVDPARTMQILNWRPSMSIEEGMIAMAADGHGTAKAKENSRAA